MLNRKKISEEKKEIRKEKNRDSARRKRAREKEYNESLEAKVRELKNEIAQEQLRIATLTQENTSIKDELQFLTELTAAAGFDPVELAPQDPEPQNQAEVTNNWPQSPLTFFEPKFEQSNNSPPALQQELEIDPAWELNLSIYH